MAELVVAALISGVGIVAANADARDDALLKCSVIEDSAKRLVCFDLLAAAAQSAADREATSAVGADEIDPASTGAWQVNVESSKIDDSTSVFLHVPAKEAVAYRFEKVRPILWIRCVENTTAFVIQFENAFMSDIQDYGDVTFRIDKEAAFVRSLAASTNNHSLGLWSGGSAIPMIKRLIDKATLTVRATPYNESPGLFEFPIVGLGEAIKPLRKACGW